MTSQPIFLSGSHLFPYLVVAGLAIAWALAEIFQSFPGDVRRALFTPWAVLFVAVNTVAALLVYLFAQTLFGATFDRLSLAIAAGLSWQALLRTRIHLLQPLGAEVSEPVSVSIADLYARFQTFCRRGIDQHLLMERRNLLQRLNALPVERLEEEVRLMGYASTLHDPESVRQWLEEVRSRPEEDRRLYLAHHLLRTSGFDYTQRLLRSLPEVPKPPGGSGT